jgi:high affinity Mn2+ porin
MPSLEEITYQNFGGHVGYSRGWVSNTLVDANPAINPTTSAPTFGGLYGRLQLGYNYLLPSRFLHGVEVDVSFPEFFENGLIAGLGTAKGTAVTEQIDYVAALRGRLGFGHWLIYATGGFAWSQARLGETPGLLSAHAHGLGGRHGCRSGHRRASGADRRYG